MTIIVQNNFILKINFIHPDQFGFIYGFASAASIFEFDVHVNNW